jgi:hypothetical protein
MSDPLDNLANRNASRKAMEKHFNHEFKDIMIEVSRQISKHSVAISDEDLMPTKQTAEAGLKSAAGLSFLANKSKLVPLMGLSSIYNVYQHSELTQAINSVLGVAREQDNLSKIVNPNLYDYATSYLQSAEFGSHAMLGIMTAGTLAAIVYTKKMQDRHLLEERSALKVDSSDLRMAVQEMKEAESFRFVFAQVNKAIYATKYSLEKFANLGILALHATKKNALTAGLSLVFGREKFQEYKNKFAREYDDVKSDILNKNVDVDEKFKRSGSSYRKIFQQMSGADNMKEGCDTTKKVDAKVKSEYVKMVKSLYEEYLTFNVKSSALQSITRLLDGTTNKKKTFFEQIKTGLGDRQQDELVNLYDIVSLKEKASNDKLNKYTLISNVARQLISDFENQRVDAATVGEHFNGLVKMEFDKIVETFPDINVNEHALMFKDTLAPSKPKYMDALREKATLFVEDHNAIEQFKKETALKRATESPSLKSFIAERKKSERGQSTQRRTL